jgi:hypothetical protein
MNLYSDGRGTMLPTLGCFVFLFFVDFNDVIWDGIESSYLVSIVPVVDV